MKILFAGILLASLATPAMSAVTLYDVPNAVKPPLENVLLKDGDFGQKVFGTTNKNKAPAVVTFESMVDSFLIRADAQGQAKIVANSASFVDKLDFYLSDLSAFTKVEFSLQKFDGGTGGRNPTPGTTKVTLTYKNNGADKVQTYDVKNGQNWFGAIADGGDVLTRVSIDTNGQGFESLSHVRLGFAAVPEPSTWAMMLGGFGMLGMATRRSRRQRSVLA